MYGRVTEVAEVLKNPDLELVLSQSNAPPSGHSVGSPGQSVGGLSYVSLWGRCFGRHNDR